MFLVFYISLYGSNKKQIIQEKNLGQKLTGFQLERNFICSVAWTLICTKDKCKLLKFISFEFCYNNLVTWNFIDSMTVQTLVIFLIFIHLHIYVLCRFIVSLRFLSRTWLDVNQTYLGWTIAEVAQGISFHLVYSWIWFKMIYVV